MKWSLVCKFGALAICAFWLAACGGGIVVPNTPVVIPTSVIAPTETAPASIDLTETPTAIEENPSPTAVLENPSPTTVATPSGSTSVNPSAVPPNNTGGAGSPANANQIVFPAGTSASTLVTDLTPDVPQLYTFGAQAGQTLYLTKNGAFSVQVFNPQGIAMTGANGQGGPWSVNLPQTGNYTLKLTGVSHVILSLFIPPPVQPHLAAPVPAHLSRLSFAPGTSSATVAINLVQGVPQGFVLGAQAGQQMFLTIGGDGTVAVLDPQRNVVEPVINVGNLQYALPQTGDYLLVLLGVGQATVTVSIPPLTTPPTPVARRIQFAPGTDSATVRGQVPASGLNRWVVKAQAGQTLMAQLTPSNGQVILVIFGVDGTVLISDHASATSFTSNLPFTEDYNIDVRGNPNGPTSYALTVTIPPPGASVPPPGSLTVTLADNGQTIQLTPGQRFLLNLGADYDWDVTVDNPAIVSRVVNILVVRGAQGVYEAHGSGRATLTAVGKPSCNGQQPCPGASIMFQLNMIVQ